MSLMFEIPAGTPARPCSTCKEGIYWIVTAKSRRMPVSVAAEGAQVPGPQTPGRGISHFANCPQARQHRRPRP